MSKPAPHYASILALHQLELDMHLGVGLEERSLAQKVIIDIRLYMPALPAAAHSDDADYICYDVFRNKIKEVCSKEYRLIEFLVHEIHRALRVLVPAEIGLWVKLHKPQWNSSYTFSDLSPSALVVPE